MSFKRMYAERSHQDSVSNPHSVTYTQVGAASTSHEHIDATANSSPGYLVMTPTNDVTPYKSLIGVNNINIDIPAFGQYLVDGVEHTHGILYDNNTGYAALEVSCYSADEEKYLTITVGAPDISIDADGSSTDISIDIVPKGTGTLQYNSVEILTVAGTAADSYLLEGASAAEFATADHNHNSTYASTGHTHEGMVKFSTGDGVPVSTPASIGIQYIDITNKRVYVAVGTGSSSDWIRTG